jgi:hypothetical protein
VREQRIVLNILVEICSGTLLESQCHHDGNFKLPTRVLAPANARDRRRYMRSASAELELVTSRESSPCYYFHSQDEHS